MVTRKKKEITLDTLYQELQVVQKNIEEILSIMKYRDGDKPDAFIQGGTTEYIDKERIKSNEKNSKLWRRQNNLPVDEKEEVILPPVIIN